jgi:hypothetical protein
MDGTEPASKEDQMSAATRTAPATPDMRRAGAALGALTLAVGLVVAVGISQASSTRSQANPVAGSAPVAHDHGWSTAAGTGQEPVINGSNGGSLRYTGIPYPAAGSNRAGGVNGTRLAQ